MSLANHAAPVGLIIWLTLGGGLCCLFALSAVLLAIVLAKRRNRT
jgi:hypothetical protein